MNSFTYLALAGMFFSVTIMGCSSQNSFATKTVTPVNSTPAAGTNNYVAPGSSGSGSGTGSGTGAEAGTGSGAGSYTGGVQGIQSQCLTKNTPAPAADSTALTIEREILTATNAYRASKGLAALTINTIMSAIARGHSQNMANNVYGFGHEFFSERIQVISCHGVGGWGAAENAAMGGGSGSGIVNMWINSPGHERNMTGSYSMIGIGVYGNYAVQIFE